MVGELTKEMAGEVAEQLKLIISGMADMREQIKNVETNIRSEIQETRNDLNEFKVQIDKRLVDLSTRINEVENSQSFISADFEKYKVEMSIITNNEKSLQKDNAHLNTQVNQLKQNLQEESLKRIESAQYYRSSFMVELSGLPQNSQNEDSIDLVKKIATLAKFEYFDVSQIDVAHRLSSNKNSPVIVMFTTKSYRHNFYYQKSKLKTLHIAQLTDDEYPYPDPEIEREANTFIYLNESLTPENRDLYIKAKKAAKAKHYKYPGYTIKGQVRVRREKES